MAQLKLILKAYTKSVRLLLIIGLTFLKISYSKYQLCFCLFGLWHDSSVQAHI